VCTNLKVKLLCQTILAGINYPILFMPTGHDLSKLSWKLVGDNLDLTVKVRDMRVDNPNQAHHFFHTIAVQDRIATDHLDDTKPQCLASTLEVSNFVPSLSDKQQLCSDFVVLVARIIASEFAEFKFLQLSVPTHIPHQYSKRDGTEEQRCKYSIMYNYMISMVLAIHCDLVIHILFIQPFFNPCRFRLVLP